MRDVRSEARELGPGRSQRRSAGEPAIWLSRSDNPYAWRRSQPPKKTTAEHDDQDDDDNEDEDEGDQYTDGHCNDGSDGDDDDDSNGDGSDDDGAIWKSCCAGAFSPDLSSPHKPQQTCPNLPNHRPHQRFRLLS